MKYGHVDGLTEEQLEIVRKVGEAFQEILDRVAESIRTIVESDGFQKLMELLQAPNEIKAMKHVPSHRLAFIEPPKYTTPMLDKMLRIPRIRNNC